MLICINVSFFNMLSKFIQTFVPFVKKFSMPDAKNNAGCCPFQATDKRLIAHWYLMQISAHFSSSTQKHNTHLGQIWTV